MSANKNPTAFMRGSVTERYHEIIKQFPHTISDGCIELRDNHKEGNALMQFSNAVDILCNNVEKQGKLLVLNELLEWIQYHLKYDIRGNKLLIEATILKNKIDELKSKIEKE